MKRFLLLVAGVVAALVGLGLILPAVALWRQSGPLSGNVIWPLLLGVLLVLGAVLALRKGAVRPHA